MNDTSPKLNPPSSKSSILVLIALSAITLLAICLRVPGASESLWVDELHTAWTVSGDLSEVAPRAMQGNNHPLYFYCVKLSTTVLGVNEFGLRFPSLLAGSFLATLLVWILYRWTGSLWISFLTGLLVVVDKDQIFFSTEARSYALTQFVGLFQLFVLVELILDFSRKRIAFCVVLSTLMIYLHYTTGLILVAEFCAVLLLCCLQKTWSAMCSLGIVLVCTAGLCLPLIPHLFEVQQRKANWARFITTDSLVDILEILPVGLLLLLPLFFLAFDSLISKQFKEGKEVESELKASWRTRFLIAIFSALLPVMLCWFLTYFDLLHLFMRRYLIVSFGLMYLSAGLVLGVLHYKLLKMGLAISLILGSTITIGAYQSRLPNSLYYQRFEDWCAAVDLLNQEERFQQLPILLASGLIEADALKHSSEKHLQEYCVLPLTSAYPLNFDGKLIPLAFDEPGDLTSWQLKELGDSQRLTLVVRGSVRHCDKVTQQITESWLGNQEANYDVRVLLKKNFNGVCIRLLEQTAKSED